MTAAEVVALRALRDRAPREPIDVDISDYSDVYCLGFLAGQANALDAVLASNVEEAALARPPDLPAKLQPQGGHA